MQVLNNEELITNNAKETVMEANRSISQRHKRKKKSIKNTLHCSRSPGITQ